MKDTMSFSVFLLLVSVVVTAAPAQQNAAISAPNPRKSGKDCQAVFSDAKIDPSVFHMVGHSTHSMTVADLRKFYPSATQKNFVPTIAQDRSAEPAILPYAPDVDEGKFINEGMKVFDRVMTKVDDKNWGAKNYSPLEKIGHAFHMQEVWSRTLIHFRKLNENPPTAEVCRCALDIENNGIVKYLRYLSLAIRYPDLVYGFDINDPQSVGYQNYQQTGETAGDDISKKPRGTLSLGAIANSKNAMGPLTGSESWARFKTFYEKMPESLYSNTAVFLFCAAKKAETDMQLKPFVVSH